MKKYPGFSTIETARVGGKSSQCKGSGSAVAFPFEVEEAILVTKGS